MNGMKIISFGETDLETKKKKIKACYVSKGELKSKTYNDGSQNVSAYKQNSIGLMVADKISREVEISSKTTWLTWWRILVRLLLLPHPKCGRQDKRLEKGSATWSWTIGSQLVRRRC